MNLFIKNLLKRSWAGLLVILLVFGALEAKQLSPKLTQALEQAQSVIPVVPSPIGVPKLGIESDEYVQTEAHLQLPEVKEKMKDFIMRVPGDINKPEHPKTPNEMVTPYMNIIAAAINKEVELKDSYYVFYQATNNEWRVPQDLYKRLYVYKNPSQQVKDFIFVRFSDLPSLKARDYLQESLEKFAGVNDNVQEVRDILLSVNLALFGNVGFPGECTWNYFLEAKSHRWPLPQNYKQVIDAFDISYDIELLAQETQALSEMLVNASEEQTLLQFCIPQSKVDDLAYVAWIIGFPAHPKSMALMEERMAGKPRVGSITGPVVKSVMKQFKKEEGKGTEGDRIYKELLGAAANGEFGISGFMKVFRNDPFGIPNANEIQARILATKEGLGNPASGIKIFSYFTTPHNIQEEYLKKLDILAKKIIDQENSKTAQQKVADKTKNETTFARLEDKRKKEEEARKLAEKAVKKK